MYHDRARYYDAIYHWKNYAQEALRLREVLHRADIADGSRILEAACGTGSHLLHLHRWFEVAGFDSSEAMLNLARQKVPAAHLFKADMTAFDVDRPCDALLCLFSSIGYVHPPERLSKVGSCVARAVRPGGVVIIEPWLSLEKFTPGSHKMQTFEDETLSLCRMSTSHREGNLSIIDFHWLANDRRSACIEHFIDRHELWLYATEDLLRVFTDAGFNCRFEPDGLMKDRGLVIGIKR